MEVRKTREQRGSGNGGGKWLGTLMDNNGGIFYVMEGLDAR